MRRPKQAWHVALTTIVAISSVCGTSVHAGEPTNPLCIAPAQPRGGLDLTCRVAQSAFAGEQLLEAPLRIIHVPGGVGAVAFNNIVTQRRGEPGIIAAFSSGSLINLVQGKFGRHTTKDVRWLASVGTDYGVAVVRRDSPFADLKSLIDGLRADSARILIGGGGSIGSQDWMKAALLARAAGIDFKSLRFVAFEGGGETATALIGNHIHVFMSDALEATEMLRNGDPVRVIAVFSKERLPGLLGAVPTAIEQGINIEWPVIRGFFMGPDISEAEYQWWVTAFEKTMSTQRFRDLQRQYGLSGPPLTGAQFEKFILEQSVRNVQLARSFGLRAQ